MPAPPGFPGGEGEAHPGRSSLATALAVLVVGLVATGALAAAAFTVRERNEDRLMRQRSREAAAVLVTNLPTIQLGLASAAEVAEEAGGETESFRRLMEPLVGDGLPAASASLWRLDGGGAVMVTEIGEAPLLVGRGEGQTTAALSRPVGADRQPAVIDLLDAERASLGYAVVSPQPDARYVAYAETRLQEDRTAYEREDEAFADLDLAVYLGDRERPETLLAASTPDLPIDGRREAVAVPFGDTELRLVVTPRTQLSGDLLNALPWLIAGVGGLVSVGYAALALGLVRGRVRAEHLADDNSRLYREQRTVAQTLQRSLLPERLPTLAGLELAGRYEAGEAGLDVGGDWYDAIVVDDTTATLVVGDVSGRGLGAATVMASLRYAIRAYALEGHPPDVILEKLGRMVRLEYDGHFATVLCAVVDGRTGAVTLASAGHPPPLVVEGSDARFLGVPVGVPVGVAASRYQAVTHQLTSGASLLAFTDGLFERRGEVVDAGLERLRQTAGQADDDLDHLLGAIVEGMATGGGRDDTAIMGVRWLRSTTTPSST